tara:strand:- start:319 stop:432 length:114 start_codon:yes stop_codon:yes gene_type:complete
MTQSLGIAGELMKREWKDRNLVEEETNNTNPNNKNSA